MKISIQHFTPVFFWLFILLGVSLAPGKEIPQSGIEGLDKITHVFLYAVLSFLLKTAFHKQLIFSYRRYIAKYYAVTIAFIYGFIMEIFQHYIAANRSFELMDLLANAVGCIAGVLVFILVYRKI